MTYNEHQYNQAPYNGEEPIDVEESSDVFQFDGYGLQNSSIITSEIDYGTAPQRDFEVEDYPRARGQLLVDEQFRKRVITLEGHITAASASALETLIDTMKRRLSVKNGNLDLNPAGWTASRRWTATLQNPQNLFADRKRYHITTCPFKAEFLCLDPYGYDEDYTASTLLNQTASTLSHTVTNDGSADSELIVILGINLMSGWTSLTLTNNTTGESMQITDTIAKGDIVQIDTVNKQVLLNGSALDFDGQFINLDAGDNDISIAISSTSHDFDVTYKHKDSYL